MSLKFPEAEQRHHVDIFPGLTFFWVKNPNKNAVNFSDPDGKWDHKVPWTVVTKRLAQNTDGGYWEYLLLGPGPILEWHRGPLGWIRRVADPVWEERAANGWYSVGKQLDHFRSDGKAMWSSG